MMNENLSPKALKEQVEQSMAELEAQRRNHYAKWEKWRSAKEEWLDLASAEDNLSDRAEWSIEACQKQIRTAAQRAINAGIDRASANHSARDIYAALQPELDLEGFYLLRAAEKATGFDVVREHPVEDNLHHFEAQNGFGMMRYLEAAKFGERTFEQIAPGTEVLEMYKIHSDTPQFKAYQDSVFAEALAGMKKSAAFGIDFKHFVSVAANIRNLEQTVGTAKLAPVVSPKDGWVGISEHLKEHALSYVEGETYYIDRYKMPDSIDYRLHERFVSPDYKVPDDFPLPETPSMAQSGVNKLRDLFTPARVTERLQNDLKLLTNNANMFREYSTILDESITEMEGEIAQMREHAAQANKEIKNGEPFNAWMRLNLRPELSAFGLDPDTATIWDLTDKLEQLGPDAQQHSQIKDLHLEEQAAI